MSVLPPSYGQDEVTTFSSCLSYLNELHVSVSEQLQPSTAAHKPTGKVVGIIKRNWRPFCGMLNVSQIKEVGVNCSITPSFVSC